MNLDFDLEIVFTGLCAFSFDEKGATAYLVNATRTGRFKIDEDLIKTQWPHPHYPVLSYSMTQQVRRGGPHRLPDRIFTGIGGEETGVCDLAGEELVLEIPGGPGFQAGELASAPRISEILDVSTHRLCDGALPNPVVVTRLRLSHGALSVLRLAGTETNEGRKDLEIQLRPVKSLTEDSGKPTRKIADQLLLRAEHLTHPVILRSNFARPLKLRPEAEDPDSGRRPRVRLSLANYHDAYHRPGPAAFDFLWFYELLDFAGPRPSRRELDIPVYVSGSTGFTGSSGVCPPVRL